VESQSQIKRRLSDPNSIAINLVIAWRIMVMPLSWSP
jgi:hypothetical protein